MRSATSWRTKQVNVPAKTSALRKAIEQVNDAQRLQPITAEEIGALGDVALWRILVEPYTPKQRGLIARPPEVEAAERVVSKVGRIVQVGCFAYQSKTVSGLELSTARERAAVGEYWLFEMYAGQELHLRSGHILRILTDTELVMRIKDPDLIKGYAE